MSSEQYLSLLASIEGLHEKQTVRTKNNPAKAKDSSSRGQLRDYINYVFDKVVPHGPLVKGRPHLVNIDGGSMTSIANAFSVQLFKEIFDGKSVAVVQCPRDEVQMFRFGGEQARQCAKPRSFLMVYVLTPVL